MDRKAKLERLHQVLAVANAMLALIELGARWEIIEALKKNVLTLINDVNHSEAVNGKKPMRLSRRVGLAAFAAAVTTVKKERGVAAAIAEVAVPHGIEQKEIKNFRDRLNKGRTDPMSAYMYKSYLADYQAMTKTEIMGDLKKLVKGGAFCT